MQLFSKLACKAMEMIFFFFFFFFFCFPSSSSSSSSSLRKLCYKFYYSLQSTCTCAYMIYEQITFTSFWTNSTDDKLIVFFLFLGETLYMLYESLLSEKKKHNKKRLEK